MYAEFRFISFVVMAILPFFTQAQCPSSLNNTNGFGTLTLFFEDSPLPDDLETIDVEFPPLDDNYAVTQLSNVYQTISNEFAGVTLTGDLTLRFADGSTEACFYEAGLLFDPLPVDLTDFSGQLKQEDILLSWKTESEINNAGFEIERSFDGENFRIIGMQAGVGNSDATNTYQFEDLGVRERALGAIAYYRLVQIDYDGKKTYSEVLAIDLEFDFKKFEITKITGWDAEDRIVQVYFYAPIAIRKINFLLADLQGQVVARESFYPEPGLNVFEVDLSTQKRSLYFLSLDNGQEVIGKQIALF